MIRDSRHSMIGGLGRAFLVAGAVSLITGDAAIAKEAEARPNGDFTRSTSAPLITGDSQQAVLEIAQRFGSAAMRDGEWSDEANDGRSARQWIRAEINGFIYAISFLNCTNYTSCSSIQLRALWAGDELRRDLEVVNRWNNDYRYNVAYITPENELIIEFDVNLAHGISTENLSDTFEWWGAVLTNFNTQVASVLVTTRAPSSTPPSDK